MKTEIKNALKESIINLEKTKKLLLAVAAGFTTQAEAARQLDYSCTTALQQEIYRHFKPYIKKKLLTVPDLAQILYRYAPASDRILFDILNYTPASKEEILILPDYEEPAFWQALYETLSEREYRIITTLYGKNGLAATLESVGNSLGVTRGRIAEIRNELAGMTDRDIRKYRNVGTAAIKEIHNVLKKIHEH